MLSNAAAKGVCVIDGAIQLTRIFGDNSAAKAFVSPSIAPLLADIKLWKVNPVCTATVENKTIEAHEDCFNLGKISKTINYKY